MSVAVSFRFPADVEGWLSQDEGQMLFDFADRCAGLVVELGSYQGRSTICLAQGAARVVGIDHMRGDAMDGIAGGYRQALLDNLIRYDVRGRVQIIDGDTAEAAALVQEPISLLFIDGDHTRCLRDLMAWLPKTRRWIMLHDRDAGDVPIAIEYLREHGWLILAQTGSLIVLERDDGEKEEEEG